MEDVPGDSSGEAGLDAAVSGTGVDAAVSGTGVDAAVSGTGVDAAVSALMVDQAAAQRRRRREEVQRISSETTMREVLAGHVEHGAPVVVATDGGATHRGSVSGVGADVVVLVSADDRRVVLIPIERLATVRHRGATVTTGDCVGATSATMRDILEDWAAQRRRVRVATTGGAVSGVLRGVGVDVAQVALDGDRDVAQVWLRSVIEVSSS